MKGSHHLSPMIGKGMNLPPASLFKRFEGTTETFQRSIKSLASKHHRQWPDVYADWLRYANSGVSASLAEFEREHLP